MAEILIGATSKQNYFFYFVFLTPIFFFVSHAEETTSCAFLVSTQEQKLLLKVPHTLDEKKKLVIKWSKYEGIVRPIMSLRHENFLQSYI